MRDLNEARRHGLHAEADLAYLLTLFGDELQAKGLIATSLTGLEAVRFYLLKKHHWLPRDVLTMDAEQIRFALSEELERWHAPKEALAPMG